MFNVIFRMLSGEKNIKNKLVHFLLVILPISILIILFSIFAADSIAQSVGWNWYVIFFIVLAFSEICFIFLDSEKPDTEDSLHKFVFTGKRKFINFLEVAFISVQVLGAIELFNIISPYLKKQFPGISRVFANFIIIVSSIVLILLIIYGYIKLNMNLKYKSKPQSIVGQSEAVTGIITSKPQPLFEQRTRLKTPEIKPESKSTFNLELNKQTQKVKTHETGKYSGSAVEGPVEQGRQESSGTESKPRGSRRTKI